MMAEKKTQYANKMMIRGKQTIQHDLTVLSLLLQSNRTWNVTNLADTWYQEESENKISKGESNSMNMTSSNPITVPQRLKDVSSPETKMS